MPVLCAFAGQWYLCSASADPKWRGYVSLIGRSEWQLSDRFAWQREGPRAVAVVPVQLMDDIRFFPTIKYRGCKVHPWSWEDVSGEPLLKFWTDGSGMTRSVLTKSVKPQKSRGWFAWLRGKPSPTAPSPDYPTLAELVSDGWTWDARDGGGKCVHVDELEKFEGPPPEGPF